MCLLRQQCVRGSLARGLAGRPGDLQIVAARVGVYVDDTIATSKVELARIEIKLVGGEVEIKSYERSPISRVRRVTGYLSKVSNFNEAKFLKQELECK
jgi:hypothetical protein